LPETTPGSVVELLKRCLRKDPRERLRDIGDARSEIDERIVDEPRDTIPPAPQQAVGWHRVIVWIAASSIAGAVFGGILASRLGHLDGRDSAASKHLALTLPSSVELVAHGNQGLALSPDGKRLVF